MTDNRFNSFEATFPVLLLSFLACSVAGCGDFFAQKPTELQSQIILSELRQIQENTHVKNPIPDLYLRPPEKIKVGDGIKVFYFCKNHPAQKLTELINNQFAEYFKSEPTKQNPKGKEYPKPVYSISPNTSTNQLIINCPNEQDADTVLEFLQKVDVPPIQVNVDCLILERFADVTMDWETSIDIDNLFGEKITMGGKDGPEFPGASLREPRRAEFGLDIGYWNQKLAPHEFRAVVDLLISRGYLRILMNPKIETLNGQKATITAREYAPLEKILSQPGFDAPFNLTDYQWVEDKLEVTPHVYADGSIGLETYIMLGSRSKPEGVVQTSIITERFVKMAENRIERGRSLVVGGIRKSEERSVVRGVPFLKDLPVLGILFSSKDFEEKATEVIFVLTPSISSGGVDYAKMVDYMRQKRAKPEYEHGLQETITDPFGATAYTEQMEKQAARAEFERLKAEIEKADALQEVNRIKEELLTAAEEVLEEKAKAAEAQSEAVKAKEEADKARRQAEKAKREAENLKAETLKSESRAQKSESTPPNSSRDRKTGYQC
jgi:hypothetical protein